MPSHKAQSHQERIPWISNHPLDVKKGTFTGKMSWLATISSLHCTYCQVIKELASLYNAHGYPSNLVYKWTKDNIKEQWEKHLNYN